MQKQSSREPDAALSTVYVERLLSSCLTQLKRKLFLLQKNGVKRAPIKQIENAKFQETKKLRRAPIGR